MRKGNHNWSYIRSVKELKRVLDYCRQTGYMSHDFETSTNRYWEEDAFPTIIGISFQAGYTYILPLGHKESPFRDNYVEILKHLNDVLMDPKVTKIAWNIGYEHKWFMKYGMDYQGRWFDGMLAKYLLDEEKPFSLESQVRRFLPEFDGYKDDTEALAKINNGWANIPMDDLAKRCALDCDLTLRLMLRFEKRLMDNGFYQVFRNLIMPLERVLAESENEGIYIDLEYLDRVTEDYSKRIENIQLELRALPDVVTYEKNKRKKKLKALIQSVKDEIAEKQEQGVSGRQISSREAKLRRYLAGEFTTKKEIEAMEPLNFGSPKQLIDFLFKSKRGLRLPVIAYTEDKDGKQTNTPSTGEDALLELKKHDESGFMDMLLKYRELKKIHSTYMVGMKNELAGSNRVHASFLIHGTVTGRLSSRRPNMQNIPRVTTNPDVKPMFIPDPGCLMLEVDYSQAELRVVAELANETVMLQWFKDKKNIHVATACKSVGKEHEYDRVKKLLDEADAMTVEQITANEEILFWVKQKKKAKTFNFGILYEQSDEMLAEGMGATVPEAKQFKEEWFETFPRIKKFMKAQHDFVKEHGYVKTMFGQKRRLPDVWAPDKWMRLRAERQSVNTPIQGTAAQFCNFSTIRIREERLKGNLPGLSVQLATVHDSILFSIKPENIHEVVPKIVEICAVPHTKEYFGFELTKVTMKVSPEVGLNWGLLKDYNPKEDYTKWLKT